MTTSPFPMLNKVNPVAVNVSDATLRDFSGGLKIVESDVTLKSKYATTLINILSNEDYSNTLRFGTKLFTTHVTNVVAATYFAGAIISVLDDGTIWKTTDAGVDSVIWNDAIAGLLPGAPSGWTGNTFANFVEIKGKLIVQNNIDKPVLISRSHVVTYLLDEGSGSNINTPIASYGAVVGDFLVLATGDEDDPVIHVSAKGTIGTFVGDPAPNDAITKNLGSYVGKGNSRIRALTSFRNKLLVFMDDAIVVVELNIYNDTGDHVPAVVDTIFGLTIVNHNTIVATEKDLLFLTTDGVHSATRSILSGNFEAKAISDDILSLLNKQLPYTYEDGRGCFAVHDKFKRKIFFIIQKQGTPDTHFGFALNYTANFKTISWSEISGWNFRGGFESERKRVFFYVSDSIYQYGNDVFTGEDYYADYINAVGGPAEGVDISFDWEFPWLDVNTRIETKQLVRVTGDTKGSAQFTFQIFTDSAYKDADDNYIPAISIDMRAGSSGGFGLPITGFGGGRRISDERFYGTPVRFKIMKMRIFGSSKERLLVSSISIIYRKGRYHR